MDYPPGMVKGCNYEMEMVAKAIWVWEQAKKWEKYYSSSWLQNEQSQKGF